jgi:pyrroloquinoline quinone biosynthesis protein E
MVLNVVLHRFNIDHVGQILEMAESLGAEYVELANTQYYGWGFLNRDRLLPTREQVARAEAVTQRFRERAGTKMRIFFVVPDYFEKRPKPCMSGWGSVFLTVAPDGTVLPCHAARMLPGLEFPNARESSLDAAWHDSEGFNRYRGNTWMKEPCRSCPEQSKDFGGCRCQAYLLTGDPANADPVCDLSPHHHVVTEAVARSCEAQVDVQRIVFRDDRNSRQAGAVKSGVESPSHRASGSAPIRTGLLDP